MLFYIMYLYIPRKKNASETFKGAKLSDLKLENARIHVVCRNFDL